MSQEIVYYKINQALYREGGDIRTGNYTDPYNYLNTMFKFDWLVQNSQCQNFRKFYFDWVVQTLYNN